ncbi:hypothetical protein AHAS_Ahas04G0057600 [Arachis hypogaea]
MQLGLESEAQLAPTSKKLTHEVSKTYSHAPHHRKNRGTLFPVFSGRRNPALKPQPASRLHASRNSAAACRYTRRIGSLLLQLHLPPVFLQFSSPASSDRLTNYQLHLFLLFGSLITVLIDVGFMFHHQPCLIENSSDVAYDVCTTVFVKGLGAVFCETVAGLICSKTNQHGKKESRCSPSYIHNMMRTLSKNNSVEKLAEIDEIRFGFLRRVPNWSVKQAIMVHLAESYQVKQRTLVLDIGNIHLNVELIGKVFGLPSQGKF